MDWNKAKTILIIGFIIIDILLISQVYLNKEKTEELVVNEQIIQVLAEKGIQVAIDVKPEYKSLPLLEVEYKIFGSDSPEIEKYLGADFTEVISEKYFSNSNGETIQIEKGKKLIFQLRKAITGENTTTENSIPVIDELIDNLNIDMDDYSLTDSYVKNDLRYMVYKKKYNGYSLENSYYAFIVDNIGVAGFEQQTINSIKETRGVIQLTKSDETLLRLLKYKDVYNDTIIGMDICYYRDESITDWEILVVDNLDPTWKVVFKSGIVKYLIEME